MATPSGARISDRRTRTRRASWAPLALAACALLLVGRPARAVPPLPSSFWGQVRLEGRPAPAGMTVVALVDGLVCGRTHTLRLEGQSVYALNCLGDDPSTLDVEGGTEGDTVSLAVDGAVVATAPWRGGTNVRLDLHVVTAALTTDHAVVAEDAGGWTATVRLGAPAPHVVRVDYETAPGTTDEEDVSLVAGTLLFHPGDTTRQITVAVRDDALDEDDESLTFRLTGAQGALLGSPAETLVIIADDDPPPVVDCEYPSYVESESAGWIDVGVVLRAPSAKTVRVDYGTKDGSALAGQDYVPVWGTLTFYPGLTRRTVRVPLIADDVGELAESFSLALSNPQNATLGRNSPALLVIMDDFLAPRDVRLYLPLVQRAPS